MHANTNTMLIIIVTGVALMLVGFGLRDRNIGMGLMGPVSYTHLTLPTSDLV